MNAEFSEKARAKLNLTLDVREKTDDGYHRIVTVFQTVDFGDEITFRPADGPLTAKTDLPFLPTGDKNLAVRAAQLFFRETGVAPMGGVIGIKKNIPVCGGLAGGSSDAAAVLRLLNRACGTGLSVSELEKLSEQLGSDVPFCVAGGTVLGEGRGEKMTRLRAMPECGVVILRPDFASSTPELFKAIDSLREKFGIAADAPVKAVYIGDSDVDLATARNSGLPCISVLWGFRSKEFLQSHGATTFAAVPQEIIVLLAASQE